jgi:DeoR family fructose operon transcriptional repressor
MIPYIRRKKILELLYSKDVIYLEQIVDNLGVSLATVRRDLRSLEEEGQIDILQGGAARIRKNIAERSLTEKVGLNKEEKAKIGICAASLVNDGNFIFIGPGTTEHWIIKHLEGKDITVVTNGSYHIDELRRYNINTIILGGEVKNKIAVICGPSTINQIKDMSFDMAFIGASGYTLNQGPSTSDLNVAEVNRVAIQNSNEVFIILDATKLGKTSRFLFSNSKDSEYKVISTDQAADMYKNDNKFIIA